MSETETLAGPSELQTNVWDLLLQTLIGTTAFFAVAVLTLLGFSVAMRTTPGG